MILKKIHFAIDKTIKTDASQKILLKRYRNYSPNQSNVIVVIGGDGFMPVSYTHLTLPTTPYV